MKNPVVRFLLGAILAIAVASLVLVNLGLASPSAWAATSEPSAESSSVGSTTPDALVITPDSSAVPTEKVTQFVQAYLQVLALLDRREGELRQAETAAEAERLESEIETEAFAAIEAFGLTTQEYLQLLGLANGDPDFGERVAARLQELESEPGT